jgi:predicted transcriptional regulator
MLRLLATDLVLARPARSRLNKGKWGLARDYPMVAPAYAATRSHLAKTMGLARQNAKGADAAPAAKSPKNSAKQTGIAAKASRKK